VTLLCDKFVLFTLKVVVKFDVTISAPKDGGDKWRLSFTCLVTRSEDSCVGLPRLYETVVQDMDMV
jgi:hypothetical protein